jgi:hypothetical protein
MTEILFSFFPVNALGYKIPYRKIKTDFKIINGPGQLKILKQDKKCYKIILARDVYDEEIRILAEPTGFISSTLIEIEFIQDK